jgi:hypothetical protein
MPAAGEVVYIEEIPHMVARGNRGGAPASGSPVSGTEAGVLRVDGVNLIGGHSYMVIVDHLRADVNASTDRAKFTLRWSDTGSAATTSSAELGRTEAAATDLNSLGVIIGWIHPATDVSGASFILTYTRIGSGATQVLADTGGINITIIDVNLTVPDTGTDL